MDRLSAGLTPDWRGRFARFIADNRTRTFDWSDEKTCGIAAADAVMAITGIDFAAPFRGYSTRFGLARQLMRLGYRSLVEYLDAHLERTQRPLCGDFVAFHDPPLDLVMVAAGRGMAWRQAPEGLVLTRIDERPAVCWSIR